MEDATMDSHGGVLSNITALARGVPSGHVFIVLSTSDWASKGNSIVCIFFSSSVSFSSMAFHAFPHPPRASAPLPSGRYGAILPAFELTAATHGATWVTVDVKVISP